MPGVSLTANLFCSLSLFSFSLQRVAKNTCGPCFVTLYLNTAQREMADNSNLAEMSPHYGDLVKGDFDDTRLPLCRVSEGTYGVGAHMICPGEYGIGAGL